MVYRDIKGNNVMFMLIGIIKLIDFGCVKRLVWVGLNGIYSDMFKFMYGILYWMVLEVINEFGYGRKLDIWSIGCIVFEMVIGKFSLVFMDRMVVMFYIGVYRGLMFFLLEYFLENVVDFVRVCLIR